MTLTELKTRIEAEALRRQAARDGFTLDAVKSFLGEALVVPPELRGEFPPPPDPPTFRWFAALHGREFVEAGYKVLLGRGPDPQGMEHYLGLLARGDDKAFILGAIAYSGEGRKRDVHVVGLRFRFVLALMRRLPLVGPIFGWLVALATAGARAREARAFEEHASRRLDAIAHFIVQSNSQIAARIEALRSVMESRD
jgi:hypothetical protein